MIGLGEFESMRKKSLLSIRVVMNIDQVLTPKVDLLRLIAPIMFTDEDFKEVDDNQDDSMVMK